MLILKYRISSYVLDPEKIEKDFSFCGVFALDNVDICVVKYILKGRGCDFDSPREVTWDNEKSYVPPNGGEIIYVKELSK